MIFLTGDIHCAEILKTFCTLPELGYDLYEITSSGLSHYCSYKFLYDDFLPNNFNLGDFIADYNFAFIEFDWGNSRDEAKIKILIKNIENEIKIQRIIYYKSLIANKNDPAIINNKKNFNCYQRINSRFKSLKEYYEFYISHPGKSLLYILTLAFVCFILYIFYKILISRIIALILSSFMKIYSEVKLIFWKKRKED